MTTVSKYDLRKEDINEKIRSSIYKKTSNIKTFCLKNTGFRTTNISKKIQNDEMLGWCYQLCFILAPFYENCILNRGTLNRLNPPYEHCWLDIYEEGEWYTFDPCFNVCCRKVTYDSSYDTHINVSFTGDEISQFLLLNLTKVKPFGIKQGIIQKTNNINDIQYGNSIKYTLSSDKNRIKTMRVKYI